MIQVYVAHHTRGVFLAPESEMLKSDAVLGSGCDAAFIGLGVGT